MSMHPIQGLPHKSMIIREPKDIYDIYDINDVNDLSEFNVLHDILNPSKHIKIINYNYSPILHGCINTRRGKEFLKTL